MSPMHLQYLKNMGVTGTLVASLVRKDQLWGLIACHHYSPKKMPYALRTACDLVAEVVATRVAVLENFTQVRTEALVRRLEGRVIEATSTHGDWRQALLEDPQSLLRMVGASGAALCYDGEFLTTGSVPAKPELQSLIDWIATQPNEGAVFASASLAREVPEFAALATTASGVLAVELSRTRREYLLWLRGEQVHEVRWAGNPHKAVLPGNDPRDLSPRRSFAVWTEMVRRTARRWSPAELSTAEAVGASLRDVALQVRTMSYLITEDRLARLRQALQSSNDGVLIADSVGRICFINEAFSRFFRRPHIHLADLEDLPPLFREPATARGMVQSLLDGRQGWRGELPLNTRSGAELPLAVRADVISRPDGSGVLGYIVLATNLSERRAADAARERVQRAILDAQQPLAKLNLDSGDRADAPDLLKAVLANASLAVMEVADDAAGMAVVPTLDGLEAATKRASDLALMMIAYADSDKLTN